MGDPGSGKSTLGLRIGEVCDHERAFNVKTEADAWHIVRSRVIKEPTEFTSSLRHNKELKKGSVIIFDEAGANLSHQDWQSLNNKLISFILQTFRYRNLIVIFTMPNLKFLTVQAQRLINYEVICEGVLRNENLTRCRVKQVQTNKETGKRYFHGFQVMNGIREEYIYPSYFKKPNNLLCKAYDKYASTFKEGLAEDIDEVLQRKKREKEMKRKRQKVRNYDDLASEIQDKIKTGEYKNLTKAVVMAEYPFLSHGNANIVRLKAQRLLEKNKKKE